MKQFYFHLLFLIPIIGFGQCPPNSSYYFSTQAQIDNFAAQYPDCTELEIINVTGDDITNLQGLNQFTSLWILNISNCPNLENLDGLNPNLLITENGYLQITYNDILNDISALSSSVSWTNLILVGVAHNPALISLNGLQAIQGFAVNVDVQNNDSLTDLLGLENLNSSDDFSINGNDNLLSLNGIESFSNVIDLSISNNSSLPNLNGLNQNLQIQEQLWLDNNENLSDISALNNASILLNGNSLLLIRDNSNLSVCNVNSICYALQNNWDASTNYYSVHISDNLPECGSISQVLNACGILPPNDECVNAFPVFINQTIEGYNNTATISSQTPSCNDTNRVDVWFTFNSGDFNSVDITVDANYSLQVWEGTCSSLTQLTNACASNILNDISVTPNTDYYIQVWSDATNGRATGLFDLLVQDATLSAVDNVFTGISIFPNPVNQVLNFKSVQTIDEIEVYNLLGQNVLTVNPHTAQTQLNMVGLNSELYIIKLRIGNDTASYKIIKE